IYIPVENVLAWQKIALAEQTIAFNRPKSGSCFAFSSLFITAQSLSVGYGNFCISRKIPSSTQAMGSFLVRKFNAAISESERFLISSSTTLWQTSINPNDSDVVCLSSLWNIPKDSSSSLAKEGENAAGVRAPSIGVRLVVSCNVLLNV